MKNIFFNVGLIATTFLNIAFASGLESVAKSSKYLEQRNYDASWKEIFQNMANIDGTSKDAASFTIASAFHNDAILYSNFYRSTISSQEEYISLLTKDKSKYKSKYATFILGAMMYEKGDCKSAIKILEKVNTNSVAVIVSDTTKSIVQICKAIMTKKNSNLSSIITTPSSNLDLILAVAQAEGAIGHIKNAESILSKSGISAQKVAKDASIKGLSDYIYVLAAIGKIEEALTLSMQTDWSRIWFKEESKEGRVINFYSPSVIRSLAFLYSESYKYYMSKLPPGNKYEAISAYINGERYLYDGQYSASQKALENIVGKTKLPPRLEERANTVIKILIARNGKTGDVDRVAYEMATAASDKVDVLSDIAWMCASVGAECKKYVALALTKVDIADPKRGKGFFVELGKLMESTKLHGKAISVLEMARDKANKNKLENNDPLMLASLAEGYRNTKSFSEHLEIYFEMSKFYPAVRQIQDAVQGVYSVEQKSAGDVKIF